MRPLIGIPLCLDERGRVRQGRTYQYGDSAYAEVLERAGATPLYLPIQDRPEELLARLDGLLVPGGDDFLPPRPYPEGVAFDAAPERQIAFDAALLEGALARQLPVLAVCYGMQLLALRRGGALHYDLPTDLPRAGPHRLCERNGRHAIRIAAGSRLAKALDCERAAVNSLHHQAVAEPGRGLIATAHAEDGVIEAIEAATGPFCVGVQWHPEKQADALHARLFEAFVATCARETP